MEKRVWTNPKAVVEQFMPNEYVAACWTIECSVAPGVCTASGVSHPSPLGIPILDYHQDRDCGSPYNQAIVGLGNDTYSLTETSKNNPLTGTFYSDGSYSTELGRTIKLTPEQLQGSVEIFWTTTYANTVYHHKGYVVLTDTNRVKHS